MSQIIEKGHLSGVWVVPVGHGEYLFVREVLVVLQHLLVLLVGLRALLLAEALRGRARLARRHRPARPARRHAAQHRRRDWCRRAIPRLTITRLCTNLETTDPL